MILPIQPPKHLLCNGFKLHSRDFNESDMLWDFNAVRRDLYAIYICCDKLKKKNEVLNDMVCYAILWDLKKTIEVKWLKAKF